MYKQVRLAFITGVFSVALAGSAQNCDWVPQAGSVVQTCGKVGIGTTVPFLDLHVKNGTTYAEVTVEGTNTGNTGLRIIGDRTWKIGSNVGGTGTGKFTIWDITASRSAMVIDTNGQVGIGTNTPGATLDVNGSFRVENLTNDADLTVSAGDEPGDPNSPTITWMRKDGNSAQKSKYGLRLDSGDSDKFKLLYGGTGAFDSVPLLTVDSSGNLTVKGDISGARVLNAVYQDVAEWVPSTQDLAPGTVVVLNPNRTNEVMHSSEAYDARVAGVVSAQPGVLLGVGSDDKEMVATTGRVKVKVDARHAPIAIGDLLVTSSVEGAAMKSEPMEINGRRFHQPGTIIGKALEPLAGGVGEILVLLSLQ